jgi:hypothetical protein
MRRVLLEMDQAHGGGSRFRINGANLLLLGWGIIGAIPDGMQTKLQFRLIQLVVTHDTLSKGAEYVFRWAT